MTGLAPSAAARAEMFTAAVEVGTTKKSLRFAARLVSVVLPRAPVRQWVLMVPHRLRAKLAIEE